MKGRNRRNHLLIVFLVAAVVLAWMSFVLEARIGGGQKYSSKRTSKSSSSTYTAPSSSPASSGSKNRSSSTPSSSSGGSGRPSYSYKGISGDGFSVDIFVKTIIGLSVIVAIGFVLSGIYSYFKDLSYSSLEDMPPTPKQVILPDPLSSGKRDRLVAQLQSEDPNFSLPLFLDLAQLLYTDVFTFAGKQQLDKLGLFLPPKVSRWLGKRFTDAAGTVDVIIGSMAIIGIELAPDATGVNTIKVGFDGNYTLKLKKEGDDSQLTVQSVYEYSVWSFSRKKGVISKGPGKLNAISCVRCGAPLADSSGGVCSYCKASFLAGEETWAVNRIKICNRSTTAPSVSHEYAPERGTNQRTLFHPELMQQISEFKDKYPDFDMTRFTGRVTFIFIMLQKAWSDMKWELARPYETDSLFQSHLYWMDRYKQEKVRNVLDQVRVTRIEPVKIQQDAYYDAITLRIHASMLDYIATEKGWLVAGNHKWPRRFTEYWTFIRRAGANERDEDELSNCPSCGSALNIGMMGKCTTCGSKVTDGEFDWVLSMIEQDEAYTG